MSDHFPIATTDADMVRLGQVLERVYEFISLMDREDRITLPMMVGKEYWDSLSTGQARTLGQAFAELVSMGETPLVQAGKNSSNAWRYRLR